MTKQEILKLHELSEEEQYQWLNANNVLQANKGTYINAHDSNLTGWYSRYESLADCAFRLRDEIQENASHTQQYMIVVFREAFGFKSYPDSEEDLSQFWEMWALDAKPIHWIQAALLARLENE